MIGSMYRFGRWWGRLWHPLAHRLGYNEGTVTTWFEDDDQQTDYKRLMVGFRCLSCDRVEGVHETFLSRRIRERMAERKTRYRDL